MKTMKIIDLLNKIVNEEETPNYIRYFNKIEHQKLVMMVCKANIIYRLAEAAIDLNDEVEILNEEDKIEKLDQTLNRFDIDDDYYRYIMENRFKINELIDEVNKLKEKNE